MIITIIIIVLVALHAAESGDAGSAEWDKGFLADILAGSPASDAGTSYLINKRWSFLWIFESILKEQPVAGRLHRIHSGL